MPREVASFSINQKGIQRVFLRVKNEGATGLIFLPVGTGSFEAKDGSSWNIKDFHFSVHPPKRGSGYTIKKTVSGAGAEQYESTAYFAKPASGEFRAIVYARTIHDMYEVGENEGGGETGNFSIYEKDTSPFTPYYILLVSTDKFPELDKFPFKVTSQKIGDLYVHIISGLFQIPPLRGVDTTTFITSVPWQGRSKEKVFLIPNEVSHPWDEQLIRIFVMVSRLSNLTFERLKNYSRLGKLGNMPDEAIMMALHLLNNSVSNIISEPQ